jgi:hypothetical protein
VVLLKPPKKNDVDRQRGQEGEQEPSNPLQTVGKVRAHLTTASKKSVPKQLRAVGDGHHGLELLHQPPAAIFEARAGGAERNFPWGEARQRFPLSPMIAVIVVSEG